MFEDALSLLSIWASMNSWLTPTVLFLLLNLMIGTIAVTSGLTSHKPTHHHPQPTFHHHHPQQQPPPQQPLQPHLTRSPSVIERLKSINLYTFYSHPSTTHFQQPPPPPQQQQQQQPDPTPEPQQPSSPTTTTTTAAPDEVEHPTMEEIYSRILQGKHQQQMEKLSTSDGLAGESEIVDHTAVQRDVEDERQNAGLLDEGVDAKADDFINRFKKQLQYGF